MTYRTADFSDYDAYFTLRGYQEMEQALEEDPVGGDLSLIHILAIADFI